MTIVQLFYIHSIKILSEITNNRSLSLSITLCSQNLLTSTIDLYVRSSLVSLMRWSSFKLDMYYSNSKFIRRTFPTKLLIVCLISSPRLACASIDQHTATKWTEINIGCIQITDKRAVYLKLRLEIMVEYKPHLNALFKNTNVRYRHFPLKVIYHM